MAEKNVCLATWATNMSDPFTAAGFRIASQDDWDRLAMMTAGQGDSIFSHGRSYRRWALDCGVELWAHIRGSGEVVGLSPHYSGRARFSAKVVKLLPRRSRFDIALGAWSTAAESITDMDGGSPIDGNFPFVFDTPDGANYHTLELPQHASIQLTAFAFEMNAYPHADAFAAAQRDSETPLATQAFIPTAAITSGNPSPPASAIIAGIIKRRETLENRVGGHLFEWARIDTHGGELDVIAAPNTIVGDVLDGGVLHGAFWLSGKVIDGKHGKRGVIDRIKDRIIR